MKITKYPDGTTYVSNTTIELHNNVFRINTYEDLWHLNQAVDAYWNEKHKRPTIIIPNLIDAQADRRFNEGESSGLKLVCKLLNEMNADFQIYHPHNPEVVEALIDNVKIIDNSRFVNRVLNSLPYDTQEELNNNLILMSSDAGGFKPLMKLCDKLKWEGETYSASKFRAYIDGKSKLTQIVDRQDFEGKDILIIDDICVGGGTFKGLAKMLRERNCGKLYLAVSHITVSNLGLDPITNYFDKVFTTNSKFDFYGVSNRDGQPDQPKNLEIYKIF
jgi:ribose-phosphate pyrophosphokinase